MFFGVKITKRYFIFSEYHNNPKYFDRPALANSVDPDQMSLSSGSFLFAIHPMLFRPRPSCSKLTVSLVNNSLKFTSSDTQIC